MSAGKQSNHSSAIKDHAAPAQKTTAARAGPAPIAAGPSNLALQSWLRAGVARAKLKVGGVDDPEERRADVAADEVMAGGNASPCACGGSCPSCRGETLRRKEKAGQAAEGGVSLALAGGRALDRATRAFFEPRFGHDLSGVRIHTGPQAAAQARSIAARAFAIGSDIVFGEGEFRPGTHDGDRLMAHELAHVLQQSADAGYVRRQPTSPAPVPSPAAPTSSPEAPPSHAPAAPAAPPKVPVSDEDRRDIERIQRAIQTNDVSLATQIEDVNLATETQKLALIRMLNANPPFPSGAQKLYDLWTSFATRMPVVISGDLPEWDKSVKIVDKLRELDLVTQTQHQFESDVKEITTANLFANRNYILDRMKLLGLSGESPLSAADHEMLRRQIQDAAYHVWQLKGQQNDLRQIVVAVHIAHTPTDKLFDPEKKPEYGLDVAGDPSFWDSLKQIWDLFDREVAREAATYPEVYAAQKSPEDLLHLSRVTSAAFGANVRLLFERLVARIEEVQTNLDSGSLNPLDLGIVHDRLFHGLKAPSGANWSDGFLMWAADQAIHAHHRDEELLHTLLGSAEAVALLVTTFATAGSLTFFLAAGAAVVAPAISAGIDYEKAAQLEAAAQATPQSGTELVAQAVADESKRKAFDEMIRSLINLVTSGVAAVSALRASLLQGRLGQLAEMSGAEARSVVVQGVRALGAERTSRLSGKPLEELVRIVGEDSSAAEPLKARLRELLAKPFEQLTPDEIGLSEELTVRTELQMSAKLGRSIFSGVKGRNIATAEVRMDDGRRIRYAEVSGQKKSPISGEAPAGEYPAKPDPRYGHIMDYDSERKIAIRLTADLRKAGYGPDAEGMLYVYSELEPCVSCEDIIFEQLKANFPKLRIKVFYTHPNPTPWDISIAQ